MELPIIKNLKRQAHKAIAIAQDMLIIEVYNSLPDAVVHGGTAIWRIYKGNRFSEDIDVYLPKKYKKSEKLKKFVESLKGKGFEVKKFREKENSVFSVFSYQNSLVRFEAVFENKQSVIKQFELADGSFISVNTLSPEELLLEKVSAYSSRKKIRDLYDIFFLLNLVDKSPKIAKALLNFAENFKEPIDSENLAVIIISGAVPKTKDMLAEIERWARANM